MYASRLRVLVLAFLCGATVLASAQAVIKTLPVGSSPSGIAMNTGTNRIYVANTGSVTVIDATTDHAVATVGISGTGT